MSEVKGSVALKDFASEIVNPIDLADSSLDSFCEVEDDSSEESENVNNSVVSSTEPIAIKKEIIETPLCLSPPTEHMELYETHCTNNKKGNRARFAFFSSTKERLYNMVKAYRFQPNYSPFTPIFCMGNIFNVGSDHMDRIEAKELLFEELLQVSKGATEFLDCFSSLFWFTYRNRFPKLVNSTITSDMGWGCMIRTGQMMLANGIRKLVLSSDWSFVRDDRTIHDCILEWFVDYPGPSHPFSIHNIVSAGSYFNVKPGDWLSPSLIAHILKVLVRKQKPFGLTMYVAKEGTIYKEEILKLCEPNIEFEEEKSEEDSESDNLIFHPIIIVVPVRLGLDSVERCYYSLLRTFLSSTLSLGIIGGKPNSSLYFIGFQDEDVILLDPHLVQATPEEDKILSSVDSFHCQVPHKLPIGDMDPSLALNFLCRTKKEFEEFCAMVDDVNTQTKEVIFEIKDSASPPVPSKKIGVSLRKI